MLCAGQFNASYLTGMETFSNRLSVVKEDIYERFITIGFEKHTAFQASQYVLPAALPRYAERWSNTLFSRS
jgi:hypothetical protein